jgi:hypothetical protein
MHRWKETCVRTRLQNILFTPPHFKNHLKLDFEKVDGGNNWSTFVWNWTDPSTDAKSTSRQYIVRAKDWVERSLGRKVKNNVLPH